MKEKKQFKAFWLPRVSWQHSSQLTIPLGEGVLIGDRVERREHRERGRQGQADPGMCSPWPGGEWVGA